MARPAIITLIGMVCLALATDAAAAQQPPVDYHLAPVMDAAGNLIALSVTVRFRASASGITPLELPSGYGNGRGEGWRHVRGLSIDGATSVEIPDPARRRIHAKPGALLIAAYAVVPTFDHDPVIAETKFYRPIIRPTWFHVVGSSLFARPYTEEDGTRTPARFDWTGPTDLAFASDLEAIDGQTRKGARRGTLRDVQTSVVIGGRDLQVARAGPVRFATIGGFDFRPQQAADLAQRILSTERAFWGDPSTPFLVTMTPLIAPSALSKTVQGTGRSGGFSTQVTRNATLDDLAVLFAHENFHTWNSTQLGGQGQDGSLGFWFSEGFTDFYARRLLLRSGVISPQQFADLWNDMLIAYAASPARTTPNAKAADQFWKDPFAERLPYQRGALLAAIWDARLRAQTGGKNSLDDVLRAQRETVARSPDTPAYRLFPKVAARLGLDVSADLARFLDSGEPIDLPRDVFGRCARVISREQPVYDRGWDQQATSAAGDVVTGLREDTAAWHAGIRNGMHILARSFERSNDATADLTIRARLADGSERDFRFKPAGKDRLRVQRVELSGPTADCAKELE